MRNRLLCGTIEIFEDRANAHMASVVTAPVRKCVSKSVNKVKLNGFHMCVKTGKSNYFDLHYKYVSLLLEFLLV